MAQAALWSATIVHMCSDPKVVTGEMPMWVRARIGEFMRLYRVVYLSECKMRACKAFDEYVRAAFGVGCPVACAQGSCHVALAVFSTALPDERRAELRCQHLTQYVMALLVGVCCYKLPLSLEMLQNRLMHATAEMCFRSLGLPKASASLKCTWEGGDLSDDAAIDGLVQECVPEGCAHVCESGISVVESRAVILERLGPLLRRRGNGTSHPAMTLLGITGRPPLTCYQFTQGALLGCFRAAAHVAGFEQDDIVRGIQLTDAMFLRCVSEASEYKTSMEMHFALGDGVVAPFRMDSTMGGIRTKCIAQRKKDLTQRVGDRAFKLAAEEFFWRHERVVRVRPEWIPELEKTLPKISELLCLNPHGFSTNRCMAPKCCYFLKRFGTPSKGTDLHQTMSPELTVHLQHTIIPGLTRLTLQNVDTMSTDALAGLVKSGRGLFPSERCVSDVGVKIQETHAEFVRLDPDYLEKEIDCVRKERGAGLDGMEDLRKAIVDYLSCGIVDVDARASDAYAFVQADKFTLAHFAGDVRK